MSFLYSGSFWSSLYCGVSLLCVGLYRWLVKVSWLGKLVLMFWWMELYFFSLKCNEMSINELWDVYGFGVTLGSLYLEAQGWPRQHIKKQRHYFANKGPSSQSYGFSSSHVWMWELDHKGSWVPKNRCFWTVVLEKTLDSPLYCKEIQPVHPKGNQSWIFIGRTDVEVEPLILWPPDVKNWLIWEDPDAGKDWGQEEKGTTEMLKW